MKTTNTWKILSSIDVNKHTLKKGSLTYLSWAWAWGIVKENFPSASYTIYRNPHTNQQWDYQEGVGYMCSTTVTIEKESLEMWLPVMDHRNKSIVNNATTFDINKTLMRCLTKNLAMFGLGHYIYAGEDLPEGTDGDLNLLEANKEVPSDGVLIKRIKDLHDKGETLEDIYKKMITTYPALKDSMRLTKLKNKTNEEINGKTDNKKATK